MPTSTPTPMPTSTPTPTPTQAPVHQPVSVSSPPSYSSFTCTDARPLFKSDLFQINTTYNSAKLFFTPLADTNQYFISFSTNPDAEKHGEQVTLLREGVQSHSIYFLKPNTTYYVKVRGQNGCATGDWSNIMKFKTNHQVYYKNFPAVSVNTSLSNLVTKQPKISSTTKTTPTPTVVAPKATAVPTAPPPIKDQPKPKKCFLWWCW